MTTKTLRPADLKAEEPVWEGKWKNLYFLKDGRSDFGDLIHISEDEAQKCVVQMLNENGRYLAWNGSPHSIQGIKCVLNSLYSHTIQIPWKEKD